MIWLPLALNLGALLYSVWCARECSRYARRAEAAAVLAEQSAQRAAESLQRIKELQR